MSDIVERLRKLSSEWYEPAQSTCTEAADEILRLRAELAKRDAVVRAAEDYIGEVDRIASNPAYPPHYKLRAYKRLTYTIRSLDSEEV